MSARTDVVLAGGMTLAFLKEFERQGERMSVSYFVRALDTEGKRYLTPRHGISRWDLERLHEQQVFDEFHEARIGPEDGPPIYVRVAENDVWVECAGQLGAIRFREWQAALRSFER